MERKIRASMTFYTPSPLQLTLLSLSPHLPPPSTVRSPCESLPPAIMTAALAAAPDAFFSSSTHSSLALLSTLLLSFVSAAVLLRFCRSVTGSNKLGPPPPSPPALPIIGHLHLLKRPLHRALDAVSAAWGPVVLLRFGSRPVLVVSSSSAVEECFTANDVVFANRPRLLAGRILGYNYTTILWAPYGPHWRNLNRLNSLHLLSSAYVRASASIRAHAARDLARSLFAEYGGTPAPAMRRVEMKTRLFELSFGVVTRMTVGEEGDARERVRFREVIEDSLRLSGTSNLGDFLPALRWVGWRGPEKKLTELRKTRDELVDGILERRRRRWSTEEAAQVAEGDGKDNGGRSAIIDVMLSLQDSDPQSYPDETMKGLIVSLISAGTDTSAVAMEWAMTFLVNHPNVLEKARAEIDAVVGAGRMVRDDDLADLPYLNSVISETLRLQPSGPLLVPHEASEDCTVGGYGVPRGTMLLVNARAIQRDPKLWNKPEEFSPERFLSVGGKEQAGKYGFIAFGAGRRRCPGEGLATRVVGLTLATLIHCFEIERTSPEMEDMTEGWGLTVPKATPLEVVYRPRPNMVATLSAL